MLSQLHALDTNGANKVIVGCGNGGLYLCAHQTRSVGYVLLVLIFFSFTMMSTASFGSIVGWVTIDRRD